MASTPHPPVNTAALALARLFGVLAGLGGILHGVGEVLQGNVPPASIFIPSWTVGPIAEHMDGDPAITLIPNLLATGLVSLVLGTATVVWALVFLRRRRGGLVLLLLNLGMLLTGGGVGPPVMGLLAGAGGLGIHARHAWWRERAPAALRNGLAALWPWIFALCAANGLFLVVGHVLLVVFFGVTNAALFLNSFFFAVVSMLLCILTGSAWDARRLGPLPQGGAHGAAAPASPAGD